jgi:hypothetical protein
MYMESPMRGYFPIIYRVGLLQGSGPETTVGAMRTMSK